MKQGIQKVLLAGLCFLIVLVVARKSYADGSITDSSCGNLVTSDIPVADFATDLVMPESDITINQDYNTAYDDGYWYGSKWMYGHDGLDTEGASETPGVNFVYAMLPGVIILSKNLGFKKGWGDSIIIATRMNSSSEEILTHHYHHLHATEEGGGHETTRLFNACDSVSGGEILAKEGTTGSSNGSHLHLSIRRWKNLAELNKAIEAGGNDLLGYGYTYGDATKLAGNLDPKGFLFNTFRDYQWSVGEEPSYFWSYPYAKKMRNMGIDFGLYDGRFGAEEPVTRRQAARWMKIGAMLESANPSTPTFTDVPVEDTDFPYIERLVRFPAEHSVLDPHHTCKTGVKYFCPEEGVKRAEALKMVIMAFYGDEFIQEYSHSIWTQSYNTAIILLEIFTDVPVVAWYAPYIYFGVNKKLVTKQLLFYPEETITKEELAKWIIAGVENQTASVNSICWNIVCPPGRYCTTNGAGCAEIPSCVPSETQQCEVGGGYDGPGTNTGPDAGSVVVPDANPIPVVDAGMSQGSADTGTGANPDSGSTPNSIPDAGADTNPGPDATQESCQQGTTKCGINCCNSGEYCNAGICVQQQICVCASGICCDGCNYKPVTEGCDQWFVYGCEGSNPGQNSRKASVRKYCSGNSGGCDGQQLQYGWQTYEDCSTAQVCKVVNGMPECVGTCTDTYLADASSACYGNPQGAGTPTLCLEVQKVSGSSFKYRVCKEGGAFQNSFSYRLKDDNNMVFFTQYVGSSGSTCTVWKDFTVSYVTAYGTVNGAGLNAEVISPSGCTESACHYRTGTVTVSKKCI